MFAKLPDVYSDPLFYFFLMLKVIDNALTRIVCHILFWRK